MNVGKIVSNSIKYPFKNIVKLPILCLLFALVAFVPIGMAFDNKYLLILGIVSFFVFILIVPGYFLSMVNFGLNESSMFPSIKFGRNIYDSVRVLVLRMAYMVVPTLVFAIVLFTAGASSVDMLYELNIPSFLLTVGLILIVVLFTYILFEILLFFAKARLAYLDSLSEALKIHKVVIDIKNIGIVNIIKWLIVMVILMVAVSFISSWIITIPYVGFLVYLGFIIPVLESIGNYSLGLLYSNIAENGNALDKFEREITLFKYFN